ncbi:MAG TPA: hypothetical protein VKT78_06480 [Fimbriimonadaceae bacterium]|nr:hypothetical protein [Fimbriimonadaceae bacterium]
MPVGELEEASPVLYSPDDHDFVRTTVQPALLGLMDGSVSTLAPLFASAAITQSPHKAFLIGAATSIGAAISMGLAEGLSDDGTITGRGNPIVRGIVTGVATFMGGMLHTMPFLLNSLPIALRFAYAVVLVELIAIAYIRFHYMRTPLAKTIVQVIVGGLIVFGVGVWLGTMGAGA